MDTTSAFAATAAGETSCLNGNFLPLELRFRTWMDWTVGKTQWRKGTQFSFQKRANPNCSGYLSMCWPYLWKLTSTWSGCGRSCCRCGWRSTWRSWFFPAALLVWIQSPAVPAETSGSVSVHVHANVATVEVVTVSCEEIQLFYWCFYFPQEKLNTSASHKGCHPTKCGKKNQFSKKRSKCVKR